MSDVERSSKFQQELKPIAYYISAQGDKALAAFEHKKYPFVGWQFHPEKIQFEHNDTFVLN